MTERDKDHGVVSNLHGNQVVGPTSNIEAHLPSIHGDPSRNGGTNVNVLSNKMDLTSNNVGVSGARIEPQPLGARHTIDHICTTAIENIPKYNGLQNGGATPRQPHNSTYKNNMPLGHEVMDKLGRIPLFEGSTLISLSSTLLILNYYKTHGVTNAFVNELLGLVK